MVLWKSNARGVFVSFDLFGILGSGISSGASHGRTALGK